MSIRFRLIALVFCLLSSCMRGDAAETITADVCVYGGTSGGVAAAVQAARLGKKTIIVEPGGHLGGMTSGGLSAVDIGDPRSVGGFAREYFTRLVASYGKKLAWDKAFESDGGPATGGAYSIEPHVAEKVFTDMAKEAGVTVYVHARLAKVQKQGARITGFTTEDGRTFAAKMFIDTTYEGDLMAKAGVSYTLMREGNAKYGETYNGIHYTEKYQPRTNHLKPGANGRVPGGQGVWDRDLPLDPYVSPGDPKSGLLPLVQAGDPGKQGDPVPGVQAYCFRLCLTTNANSIPLTAPTGYDPKRYELVARFIQGCLKMGDDMDLRWFSKYDALPNGKFDFNTATFGGNLPGASWAWPDASYTERENIAREHENYHRGLLYFLATDPRVPAKVRAEVKRFGLPCDEFQDTGGWPHQIYVREGRRMISDLVITEHHTFGREVAPNSISLGSYGTDTHEIRRIVKDGVVTREGKTATGRGGFGPYQIGYGAIVPKASECENLFVTFALSASHTAFSSIRMEPVFMVTSQSAASAACIAIDDKVPVQKVDYPKLRKQLDKDGEIVEWKLDKKTATTISTPKKLAFVDLSEDTKRQVVIAQGTAEEYQGHPTTLMLPDGKTMFCVWTRGHGGPVGPMKRSDDGGKTWSDLLTVPENWSTVRNCPALYRLTDPQGVTRLFVFAGQGPGGTKQPDNGSMQQSYSTDNGKTWTPMTANGLTCVMPFCTIVPVDNGKRLVGLTNIRRPGETKDKLSNIIAQSESTDGGLSWSPWRILVDLGDLKPCEPEIIRSPDGKQLLCIMRENVRTEPAHFITSDDEGRTWSKVSSLPPGLHGDRHKARYAPDGRLVICFRDMGKDSPTMNHFVAWVGRYEDILSGRDGEYKIKLLHSYRGSDYGYPGLELLPDDTFVATTYVKYRPGPEKNSVVSTRFKLTETDKAKKTVAASQSTKAAGIVLDDDQAVYTGTWITSGRLATSVGANYRHDDRAKKAAATARFTPKITVAGRYEVRLLYVAASNRARNATVKLHTTEGDKTITLNQQLPCLENGIPRSLGVYQFSAGTAGYIEVSNPKADGFVVVDGLQLVPEAIAQVERNTQSASGFTGKTEKAASIKIPPPMLLASAASPREVDGKSYDLVVIGGTPGGIACAVRAAREGLKVLLVNHTQHLGGFVTSGAGGWEAPYDGLRSPLYGEMRNGAAEYYAKTYGKGSPQHLASLPSATSRAHIDRPKIEPRIAELLFNQMVEREKSLTVLLGHIVDKAERKGSMIQSATLRPMHGQGTVIVSAKVFADAMYEGDLMAAAGVTTQIGREARTQYNEPHAGVIYTHERPKAPGQRGFPKDADEGRLNIRYNSHATGEIVEGPHSGEADGSVMAYNYRLILTRDPNNKIMLTKPAGYDVAIAKAASGGGFVPNLPNDKVAWNGGRLIGPQNGYPAADWPTRERISQQYLTAMLMRLWYIQNDPTAPEKERKNFTGYGLAADEFTDNHNLPYEIYVREARRLVGRAVFTEQDNKIASGIARTPIHTDSIAITDWPMDSVACLDRKAADGHQDGIVFLGEETRPAQVPYRCLLAKEVDNLLVPVSLSASHIGWGAIRLEPVWMQTGESAGFAAALAVKHQTTPAQLNLDLLMRTLVKNRVMVSFFNDVEMTSGNSWLAAVEYFGTKGFFHDYNARADEPLKADTAKLWADSLKRLRDGTFDANSLARQVAASESGTSRPVQRTEFMSMVAAASKVKSGNNSATINRGEAAEMMFNLLP